MLKIWETPLEKTSRAQEGWEGAGESQGILQEHPHGQNFFGFLELVLHQGDFRVESEQSFCFRSQRRW